jgi:DNA-binding beta-propeller fold protein YncE
MNIRSHLLIVAVACGFIANSLRAELSFTNYESPQAHSLAVSSDGSQLYAANTPANLLAVYSLEKPNSPKLLMEIPVGIEPISVAVRNDSEVWVLNHISDSISVVHLKRAVVLATIQVGDRPGDIVFAAQGHRAFVSSMTERCVYVIDTKSYETISKISIAGNNPRSLAVSKDGEKVWVAIHHSGNQTTVVGHDQVPDVPRATNPDLPAAPGQGLIVNANDKRWRKQINMQLEDYDVMEIDTKRFRVTRSFATVGTILFNLAQHPQSGDLWVTNTEARNLVRFEPVLRGHVVDNRITIVKLKPDGDSVVLDLNEGMDYSILPNQAALETTIAQPTDVIFNQSGSQAFVTSYGTDRIGIMDGSGKLQRYIEVGDSTGASVNTRFKRGPRALALHPAVPYLYVLNRLSNSISVLDLQQDKQIQEVEMQDPTPQEVRQGRGYLFDAKLSGNGTVSCASCHIDGDRDGLAWDLGDPGGKLFDDGSANPLHPMKGPLMTQTLRGLAGDRIFHWRADRPGLTSFNGTFPNLMGGSLLADDDMQLFADYMKSIRFGSNPLTENAETERGKEIFHARLAIAREGKNKFRCIDCHKRISGSGSTGFSGLIGQSTKAAQLRGLNERLVFQGDIRVNGFGFGADGSKETLFEFLSDSHRFEELSAQDKKSLESFLLSFPTETPAIVGETITLSAEQANDTSTLPTIIALLEGADEAGCKVKLTGRLHGTVLQHTYIAENNSFSTSDTKDLALDLEELLQALSSDDAASISMTVHMSR